MDAKKRVSNPIKPVSKKKSKSKDRTPGKSERKE
jgi:hypothetical protein